VDSCRPISGISRISLTSCPLITDISPIILSPSSLISYLVISKCNGVTDISCLSLASKRLTTLKLLHLTNIGNSDFPILPETLEALVLEDCRFLSSIHGISQCKYITLSHLPEVEDVSMLGNVTSLSIIGCPKVSDISELGNIPYLTIKENSCINDFSYLGNHKVLKLSLLLNMIKIPLGRFSEISHIEVSRTVITQYNELLNCEESSGQRKKGRYVDISGSGFLRKLTGSFIGVHTLIAKDCFGLKSLLITSPLTLQSCSLYEVNLSNCHQLTNVDCLKYVKKINLSNCSSLMDIRQLGQYQLSLNLSNCYRISSFSSLTEVPILNLSFLFQLSDLSFGKNIKQLNISVIDVTRLTSLGNLLNLEILTMSKCYGKIVIPILPKLKTILIHIRDQHLTNEEELKEKGIKVIRMT
jgi:hypothetical protein